MYNDILIGNVPPVINGVSEIKTLGTYLFHITKNHINSTLSKIIMAGGYVLAHFTENSLSIYVPSINNTGLKFEIRIRVRENSDCGMPLYTTKLFRVDA